MYYPNIEDFKRLSRSGNLIPIYREINADLETPVSAYLKVARGNYSFLLESVEGGEKLARYSFIGTEPSEVIKTGKENVIDPLILVEEKFKKFKPVPLANLPGFCGGFVGYLSYDVNRYFEKLPDFDKDTMDLPESILVFADTILVFDHVTHKIKIISHAYIAGDIEISYQNTIDRIDTLIKRLEQPLLTQETNRITSQINIDSEIMSNISQNEFESMVSNAKDYIFNGDIIQVVLSQRFSRKTKVNPFSIYRELRSVNPSPYMYYLQMGDFCLAGASPELLVQVDNGLVSNHPIAGTRPRSNDPVKDTELENELRNDEKERAEHIMLVDLGRNDVGRVSEPGTVEVTQLMDIERYSHVMHLVSHVQGKLKQGSTSLDAFRSCFPAGTVSGAPKIRAMEVITELEKEKRGPYAGAVGYFDFLGNLETAICIRTIVIKNDVAYVQAGAGIVADSIPEREYYECLNKAKAMLMAIDQAEKNQ